MQSPRNDANGSNDTPATSLGRELYSLDTGDGIGIIDAVSRALEQLEADEAVEMAYTTMDEGGEGENFGGPANPDYDDSGEHVDAGPLASNGLMTAEEVNMALASSSAQPSRAPLDGEQIEISPMPDILEVENNFNLDLGPRQRRRLGQRRRKQSRSAQDSEQPGSGVALYGGKGTVPFSKRIANYFATVGSTQEKRVIALAAWGVSVVGLLVCLVFVTKDFVSSKSEAMVAVRYLQEDFITLPSLYICTTQLAFPTSANTASRNQVGSYGAPMQWVELLREPGGDSQYFKYPDTLTHPNVESVVIDRYGEDCTNVSLVLADAARFYYAYASVPRCFPCFKIKSDPPMVMSRALASEHYGDMEKTSLSVQVATSRTLHACRNSRVGLPGSVGEQLVTMILQRKDELERLGVLDFSGQDPTEKRTFPGTNVPGDYLYVSFHFSLCLLRIFLPVPRNRHVTDDAKRNRIPPFASFLTLLAAVLLSFSNLHNNLFLVADAYALVTTYNHCYYVQSTYDDDIASVHVVYAVFCEESLFYGAVNSRAQRLTGSSLPSGEAEVYVDRILGDINDMMCNTVLFSGVWYPKPTSQEIKYKYDTDRLRWVRSGAGPYYPPKFSDFFQEPTMNGKYVMPNQELAHMFSTVQTLQDSTLNTLKLDTEALTMETQRVFVESPVSGAALVEVSSLKTSGTDTVFFQENKINNATSYVTTSEATTTITVDGRNVNFYFLFRFSVRDFLSRNVSNQSTVQVSSFLADFFGLIELFLDLSVYTLIISPIVVATKRRSLLARAHAASPISPV